MTQAQYQAVMGSNPSQFKGSDDLPVDQVSWLDAVTFCNRLSERENRKPYYRIDGAEVSIEAGDGYRLPTEAEWEYACRAGTATRLHFGDDEKELGRYAWYAANANGRTHPVRTWQPNTLGLYDIYGNVWEWCWDRFDAEYYNHSPVDDPRGPERGAPRVVRGGALDNGERQAVGSASRGALAPETRYGNQGFRIARNDQALRGIASGQPGGRAKAPDSRPSAAGIEVANRTAAPLALLTAVAAAIPLKRIPAGDFLMGSPETDPDAEADEKPQHRVQVGAFYMGVTEVTRGQFRRFVEQTGYQTDAEKDGKGFGWDEKVGSFRTDPAFSWRETGFFQNDEHPVVNVSWNDAMRFCDWLSRAEGRTYRLPTEAEWEYACRAGTTTRYSSGDDPEGLAAVANTLDWRANQVAPDVFRDMTSLRDGFVFSAPVAKFGKNGFGLYDMHGNVWELCQDGYDGGYYGRSPADDPPGPSQAPYRVLRGGGWR